MISVCFSYYLTFRRLRQLSHITCPFLLHPELDQRDYQYHHKQNHSHRTGISEFIFRKRTLINVHYQHIRSPPGASLRHRIDEVENLKAGDRKHDTDKNVIGVSIGIVILRKHCQPDAPSILAASYSSPGIPCRPAR